MYGNSILVVIFILGFISCLVVVMLICFSFVVKLLIEIRSHLREELKTLEK